MGVTRVEQIEELSSIWMYIPEDLLPVEALENTLRKVEEVLSRFAKDGISLLDQEEDIKVRKHQGCMLSDFLCLCGSNMTCSF